MKNRQVPVRDVGYASSVADATEIEVLSLDTIRINGGSAEFVGPQRPQFHLLALVTEGSALHTIDFVNYAVSPPYKPNAYDEAMIRLVNAKYKMVFGRPHTGE